VLRAPGEFWNKATGMNQKARKKVMVKTMA
jgi:hypothetical protein